MKHTKLGSRFGEAAAVALALALLFGTLSVPLWR